MLESFSLSLSPNNPLKCPRINNGFRERKIQFQDKSMRIVKAISFILFYSLFLSLKNLRYFWIHSCIPGRRNWRELKGKEEGKQKTMQIKGVRERERERESFNNIAQKEHFKSNSGLPLFSRPSFPLFIPVLFRISQSFLVIFPVFLILSLAHKNLCWLKIFHLEFCDKISRFLSSFEVL